MNLTYRTTTEDKSLRTIHIIVIEAESLTTTKAKEVLIFAKSRINSKIDWKRLKNCVRLGEPLQISGGE